MEMPLENHNNDAFRRKFKYYKSKKPKPSLSEVLILNDDGNNVDTVRFNNNTLLCLYLNEYLLL